VGSGSADRPALPGAWTVTVQAQNRNGAIAATYLVFGALALSPLFWTAVPPLVDYPAYLARMAILAAPGASQNYVVHWQIIPNLAMDLVVPPLSALVGVETAGRLFIGSILMMLLGGTVLLHRALFGRIGLWPLASLVFIYNFVLFFGFLNFLFGLGLALLCFSFWIANQNWQLGPRLAAFAGLAAVLFICHLFAFGVYGLLVGSYEFGVLLTVHPLSRRAIARFAATFLQFVPAVALWSANASPRGPHTIEYGELGHKIEALLAPMNFGVFGSTLAPLVAGLVMLSWRNGALQLAPQMRWPILALLVAALAMPDLLYGSRWADIRLPVVLAFIFVGSMRPQGSRHWLAGLAAVVAVGLVGARIVAVTLVWRAVDREFSEFRAVTRDLPGASRLLVARQKMPEAWGHLDGIPEWFAAVDPRCFWHMSDLAVLDRDAFIPTIGLQLAPVEPAARNIALDGNSYPPLLMPAVIDGVTRAVSDSSTDDDARTYFWADWPHRFDYLLIIDFGDRENPVPDLLKPFAQGSFFTYYKIVPGPDDRIGGVSPTAVGTVR
jgi:hypothetical protein